MQPSEIKWTRAGFGRQATVYAAGDRVFDLYQDRAGYPLVQVCEFPVYGPEGEAVSSTYYVRGEDGMVRFLSDKIPAPQPVAQQLTSAA